MAVTREKVESDPLTMFMNDPNLVNMHEKEPIIDVKPVIRVVSKPAPEPSPISAPTTQQSTSNVTPVTVTTVVNASAVKSTKTAHVVVNISPPPEDEEPIFGRAPVAEVGDDLFQGVDVNKAGKGSHILRLGNEGLDDDKLDDLKVNKLLEEENDLDFELFGSSEVTMSGYTKANTTLAPKQQNSDNVLDDLDLDNGLIDLDIKEPDANIFTAAMQYTTTVPSEIEHVVTTADFDINSYIKSQEEDNSGGGLFD